MTHHPYVGGGLAKLGRRSLKNEELASLIIADFQKLAGEDNEDASECCRSSSI